MMIVDGPILTDCNGNLREPIWSCHDGGKTRCKHFTIHEGHHFYCAAQPIESQTYPFPGAGKQLADQRPDFECPYRPYSL